MKTASVLILALLCCASCSPSKPQEVQKQALPVKEGFIDVPGGKVWYRVVGAGPATPLLVLHGGPGIPSDYLSPLGRLADERPVIFYDQLGCGKSEKPTDKSLWTTDRFVREVAAVRDKLGLNEIHLLGHSWGTMLGTDYMLTQPAGVRSVIFSSPAISIPRWLQDANRFRAQLPPAVQATLKKHEDAGTTDSAEYQQAVLEYYKLHLCRIFPFPADLERSLDNLGTEVYNTMWGPSEFYSTGVLKDFERSDRLHEIVNIPVLFTAGRYDEATPETTKFYQSQIPNSELVIFENSSHMAMLEETDRYIATVRDFLHRVEKK